MRAFLASCSVAVALALGAAAADAKGTVRVQLANGSTQTYSDVTIKIAQQTLHVTTADGAGTLVIDKAACSYAGELQRCLPYSMTLDQGGGSHPLDFQSGTVYLNLTDSNQTLPLSSLQLPPRGILLGLKTKIGTYISLSGVVDVVQK